ncbi:MAG: hypothetical protein ACR2O0_03385 [Rhizobiaceae bacterium]
MVLLEPDGISVEKTGSGCVLIYIRLCNSTIGWIFSFFNFLVIIMRIIGFSALIAIVVLAVSNTVVHAGESGWMSINRLGGYSRTLRRSSEIPVNIECRNASRNKSILKVEAFIKTAPNAQNKNWTLYALEGEYRPGKIKQTEGWKRVSGNVLVSPASGKRVHCSIYHHVNRDSFSNKPPSLWIKVGAGYRSLH